jgi:hypothetical protein
MMISTLYRWRWPGTIALAPPPSWNGCSRHFPRRHSLWKHGRFASYDANNAEQARCLDTLLEQFPNNARACSGGSPVSRMRRRQERIKFLEAACGSRRLIRRCSSGWLVLCWAMPAVGGGAALVEAGDAIPAHGFVGDQRLGDLLWEENQLEEATELYRFAANLEGFREHLCQSWFVACRRTRRAGTRSPICVIVSHGSGHAPNSPP